jgi:hypothetical protein
MNFGKSALSSEPSPHPDAAFSPAGDEPETSPRQPSRMKRLLFPREHGAWGILGVPLATGSVVGLVRGSHAGPVALFTLAAAALFCARTPLESLLGSGAMRAQSPRERRAASWVLAAFLFLSALAVALLLWGGRNLALLLLGAATGLLLMAQYAVRRLGRARFLGVEARMAAQLMGAFGLTAAAAGAYYVATGRFDSTALALWFANWAFAGNQIHFVQLRIRAARAQGWPEKFRLPQGRQFFVGQWLMLAAVALAWRLRALPPWATLAFLPVSVRGVFWFFRRPRPLRVHRLGLMELAHAVVFGALLVAGFLAN